MRFRLFYHSLLSDWNHGNAHFLRGVAFELLRRGHEVRIFEPRAGWSLSNLLRDHGSAPIEEFRARYPGLESEFYDPITPQLDALLEDADVVIVHEWNDPDVVRQIGQHRARSGSYALLFHDTHHRLVTRPAEMASYDLSSYEAVLAFGDVLRRLYLERGLCERAFTWHEAADTRVFFPLEGVCEGELVWIGNWGDGERTAELDQFLLGPVAKLRLRARVHGVRYPTHALDALARAGIHYAGFLPNFQAPEAFGKHGMTVHVPRRPYVEALVGVPTIRVFEALACGIPLVSAPWEDAERLFSPGDDYLVVNNGAQMADCLDTLRRDHGLRAKLRAQGLRTIRERHTCVHRVDELFSILRDLGYGSEPASSPDP